MKAEKRGSNWTAYYDPDTKRYFAEIMYTSREGREQYDYEITQDIYGRLGTFQARGASAVRRVLSPDSRP